MINFLANLIWMIFGGLALALLWCALGLLLCITVVGIPFGIQCFKIAKLSLFPFGKKVKLNFSKHKVANILWFVLCGWAIALLYFMFAILNIITIIGFPKGIYCFKIMKLAISPFGAVIK